MKILFVGSSGLLGRNMIPLLKKEHIVIAPTHKELDITKEIKPIKCDLVINAAAYTDVLKAETDDNVFLVNVVGTYNLATAYKDTPFVYISTEYVKNPVNRYSHSKLMGEYIVKGICSYYYIIRTLFKPTPWAYEYAFIDQYTGGDYVDVITRIIVDAINRWQKKKKRTFDIQTGRKTMFELAKQTKPDVKPNSVDDIKGVKLPKDYVV